MSTFHIGLIWVVINLLSTFKKDDDTDKTPKIATPKITINNKLIDLRYLNWSKARDSSGTAGSYLKSYSYKNGHSVVIVKL